MKTRFYLHNKVSAEGRHPIYIEVRWSDHEAAPPGTIPVLRLSTGKNCQAAHFTEKGRVKKDLNSSAINNRLVGLEKLAGETLDKAAALGQHITPEQLKAVLVVLSQPRKQVAAAVPAPTLPTLAQVAQEYLVYNKTRLAPNYLRKLGPVVATWEAFRPGTRLPELLPDPVTRRADLLEEWVSYLLEEHVKPNGEIGLENNSVSRYLSAVRQLLNFSGLASAWIEDEFTYTPDIEPLEYDELMALAELPDLNTRLANVRDCFVFNAFTGPRFGSLRKLQPQDVKMGKNGQLVLEYAQNKVRTAKKVTVPLTALAAVIWERYEGKLPVPSNQKMNTYIKEVAQLAGLDRPILQVRRKGTANIERRGPLWEFITCHTARHTFGTLVLEGGAALTDVQDSLGHSDIKSTRRYAKTREKQRHQATMSSFDNLSRTHTDSQSVRAAEETHNTTYQVDEGKAA